MKILSFQPDSIYQNGGCGRVLRRLYAGYESDITSIYISYNNIKKVGGPINEVFVTTFPKHKKWMRWKLRNISIYLRHVVFKRIIQYKIRKEAEQIQFDILHIINHGPFCNSLCTKEVLESKRLWASFHDHYSLCSSFKDCAYLWNNAERRLVISKELGHEYQRLFGYKDFEIITDGVSVKECSSPMLEINNDSISVYFGGLLHIDYYPLFIILAEALDNLAKKSIKVKLILRGTQKLLFLENRSFDVEYRTDFVSDAKIKEEIDCADILYLPIKFSHPEFYLYSLSTKMIGYLGASGTILYHGPKDSAACKLLEESNAAVCCTSLNLKDMEKSLKLILGQLNNFSSNAKTLAISQFEIDSIQKRFWNL